MENKFVKMFIRVRQASATENNFKEVDVDIASIILIKSSTAFKTNGAEIKISGEKAGDTGLLAVESKEKILEAIQHVMRLAGKSAISGVLIVDAASLLKVKIE